MKGNVLTAILVCGSVVVSQGQYINLYFTDSTTESYGLADVSSIKFEGAEMQINLLNATTLSWNTSVIEYFDYEESVASVDHESASFVNGYNVYPNPSMGEVHIEFEPESNQMLVVDIFNIDGEQVIRLFEGKLNKAVSRFTWNRSNSQGKLVSAGIYICRIGTEKHSVSRIVIIVDR